MFLFLYFFHPKNLLFSFLFPPFLLFLVAYLFSAYSSHKFRLSSPSLVSFPLHSYKIFSTIFFHTHPLQSAFNSIFYFIYLLLFLGVEFKELNINTHFGSPVRFPMDFYTRVHIVRSLSLPFSLPFFIVMLS